VARAAGPQLSSPVADAGADADWGQRLFTLRRHGRPPIHLPPPRILSGQDDFDVLDYDLSISLETAAERITGSVSVRFQAAPGASSVRELVLDLDDALTVPTLSGVYRSDGTLLRFERLPGEVRVQLAPPLVAGTTQTVTVKFSGEPVQEYGLGLQFSRHGRFPDWFRSIYTMSEPYNARRWWPSKDRPDDKATLTLRVDAPEDLTVLGPGRFVSRLPTARDGRDVTVWREDSPIATYLVSLAASRYADPEQEGLAWTHLSSVPPEVETPIRVWAFPDEVADARGSWSVLPDMMRSFSDSFGEYPFAGEKYAHAEVQVEGGDLWAAMENQTLSTFSSLLCTGTDGYEAVVAHELAHQWFGDSVTPAGYDDLWLKEGFATWAEAFWREETTASQDEYFRVLRSLDPLIRTGEFPGTVDDPVDADGDGWPDGNAEVTVYFKGAWILHMLRWVLARDHDGTVEPLLRLLRAWTEEKSHDVATTEEFVAFADRFAVRELGLRDGLTQFFEQWLHRQDRPCYAIGTSVAPLLDGSSLVHVEVEQRNYGLDPDTDTRHCVAPLANPYRMPVLLGVTLPSETIERLVMHDGPSTHYEVAVPVAPTAVTWDQPGWILKATETVDIDLDDDGWPDDSDGCPLVPNAQQEDLDQDGVQDACQPGRDPDRDDVTSAFDCAPADGDVWTPPGGARDATLRVRKDGGSLVLDWVLPSSGIERPYVGDVGWGRLSRLQANRSVRDLRCIETGAQDGTTTAPAIAGSAYFVVLPWNGCGERWPSGEPLSPCR
jgi:hypothetical protein